MDAKPWPLLNDSALGPIFLRVAMDIQDGLHIFPSSEIVPAQDETPDLERDQWCYANSMTGVANSRVFYSTDCAAMVDAGGWPRVVLWALEALPVYFRQAARPPGTLQANNACSVLIFCLLPSTWKARCATNVADTPTFNRLHRIFNFVNKSDKVHKGSTCHSTS